MNKEHTHTYTHKHDGILLSHKKEWKLIICNEIDELRGYYAVKSSRERQRISL